MESIGFVWSVRKTYRHEHYDPKDVGESEENTKESALDDSSPPLKKKLKTEDGEKVEEEPAPTNVEVQQVEVTKAEEVQSVLAEALKYKKGPTLVHVEVIKEENVFPMIPPGATYDDMVLEAPTEKMEKPKGST